MTTKLSKLPEVLLSSKSDSQFTNINSLDSEMMILPMSRNDDEIVEVSGDSLELYIVPAI